MDAAAGVFDEPAEDDSAVESIQAEYPDWHVWMTQGKGERPGTLMATRRRDLTDAELRGGLARTLPMGHAGDLRKQLAEQSRRENDFR